MPGTIEELIVALWWMQLSDEQKAQIGEICEDL